ncbi:MAG: glycosyltransferase family 2 protein, partial [Chloroflexi bacterium]|nr:glycosyltransferase family 2 protein [Chloroflexota bacterium]
MPQREIGLSALIPVYNEQDTLEEIVRRLERVSAVRQIIVVDDGSSDRTAAIVHELVKQKRITATHHGVNRGKGAALRSALSLAEQEYLVIQDGDLEYDPKDFHAMIDALHGGDEHVVYGSRFLNAPRSGMIWSHFFGNRLLTFLFNLIYGQRLTDMETCYKLFRTDVLKRLGIDNDRFDVDPELTAKIVRAGYRITEVPVSYAGRPYLAGKKIRPRDAFSAIRTL